MIVLKVTFGSKTTDRLPESSPGLLWGKFFKLFRQLLSEEGDMIFVAAVRTSSKVVFRMRQKKIDQRSEKNKQRKTTARLHVVGELNSRRQLVR